MNDLLFYTLILVLLYYFFVYLPHQKSLASTKPIPLTQSQFTQTEPIPLQADPTLEPLLDDLITQIRKLNHTLN